MRILQIVGRMGRGGVETWLMNVYRHIDREQYQFSFLPHRPGPQPYDDEIRQLGGTLLPGVSPARLLAYRRHLLQVLDSEGPYDVVHAHGGDFVGFVLRYAAKAGVPVRIAHSHNTKFYGPNRRWRSYVYEMITRRWTLKYASVGLGCSRPAAAALFGPDWHMKPRFGVLYCGVDFSPFRLAADTRENVRKERGIPLDAPVVGHVGSFTRQKNHRFLIEVAAEIAQAVPAVYFLLVGDGHLRPQVESDIQRLGLKERVVLTGETSDVPALMHAMDVFALPSLFEGLPLVLVEAQCAGLRCVVSNVVAEEGDILRDHIRRLALSAGARAWSEAICASLRMPRPDADKAWAEVANSPFAITNSVAALAEVYETGRPP